MPNGILGWLLIGLVAGALGKLIMPGRDPGGIIVTIVIGIAGALLAFYLTPVLGLEVRDSTWQAYAAATKFWSYPILIILVIGTWRTHRRSQPQQEAATP